MVETLKHEKQLDSLKLQYRDVESKIVETLNSKIVGQFQLADLKKEKINIKENIEYLEMLIFGNTVA